MANGTQYIEKQGRQQLYDDSTYDCEGVTATPHVD